MRIMQGKRSRRGVRADREWRTRRPLILGAALLLLTGASGVFVRGCDSTAAVLLCDVSWSTGLAAPDLRAIAERSGLSRGRTKLFVFGEGVVPVDSGRAGWPIIGADLKRRAGSGGTRLSAALNRVVDDLPAGGRIVVATDGRVDPRTIVSVVHRLEREGIAIEFVLIGARVETDFRIEALRLPSRVGAGTECLVDVAVSGPAGAKCRIELRVDGEIAAARPVTLGPTGRSRLRLRLPPPAVGFREVTALLRENTGDPQPRNDRRSAGLVVDGGRSALVVNAPELVEVLGAAGYRARSGRPEEAGNGLDDLCVLRDVSLPELGDAGLRLRSFVEAGGGLIVIGGPSSFGPGGYAGRPLSECLPVRSAPEGEGLEVTVLLDRSGTMAESFSEEGGGMKLRAARRAVRRLIASLPDGTGFSLIPFAEKIDGLPKRFLLSRGTRADALLAVERVVRATGSTALTPPLSAASWFAPDLPDRKWLVLLVTDGLLTGESEDAVVGSALELARAGARVHALAVGRNANVALLSRVVGASGEVRVVRSSGGFESSFLAALLSLEGEGRLLTGKFEVRRGAAAGRFDRLPLTPLRGLVRTWKRDQAEVLLETVEGYPVVVRGRYGLGRAAVITTDPLRSWAPGWPVEAVLADLAAGVRRPADLGAVRVSIETDAAGASIDLFLTGSISAAEGVLDLPDGTRRTLRFRPVGAGRLSARLEYGVAPGAAML